MAKAKAPAAPWYERVFPDGFAPKPTVITGGVERMVRCFEELRDLNTGGYKGGFLKAVEGWGFKQHLGTVTSCSPFTGTVIAMMFDPDAEPSASNFKPLYDGADKRPLPPQFYHFHNTSLPDSKKVGNAHKVGWREALPHLKSIGVKVKPGHVGHYGSVGSIALWNLGYEIDPRDMRRGDHVHIDWSDGGGHAVFCWDVHLNAAGEVDCFQFVSSNGSKKRGGVGVSVSTSPGTYFIEEHDGRYTKKPEFDPYFVDRPDFVTRGSWKVLPGFDFSDKEIAKAGGFRPATPKALQAKGVKRVQAIRFWGFPPPDRSTPRGQAAWANTVFSDAFPKAAELARYAQPAPYCMGEGRRVQVAVTNLTAVTLKPEHLAKPEDIRRVATKPAQQRPEHVTPEQLEVEHALQDLFRAGLIDAGPGDVKNVHDADTVKAVRAFQRRFGLKEDGVAGPVTQGLLFEAATRVRRGEAHLPKPPPAVAQPAAKPAGPPPPPERVGPVAGPGSRVDRFYLLQNHAEPGDALRFAVEGVGLDAWGHAATRVNLVEKTHGTHVAVVTPVAFAAADRGSGRIALPKDLAPGTVWSASLDCELPTGLTRTLSPVELTITDRPPEERVVVDGSWPWDERSWPARMRAILKALRETPRPEGPCTERWAISTFGVKEKLNSVGPRDRKTGKLRFADGGDIVPIKDRKGTVLGHATRYSLFAADIEGTLRAGGRVLNGDGTGRPRGGKPPHDYSEFDHTRSFWRDVTDRHPWGSGSYIPLIPFRVLAINSSHDTKYYGRRVYIRALDGVRLPPTGEVHNGVCIVGDCGSMDAGRQFDFFKGRQDVTFRIAGEHGMFKNSKGVTLPDCDVQFLDQCPGVPPPKPKKPRKPKA